MKPELLSRDGSVLVAVDYQEKLMPHIYGKEAVLKKAELLLFAAQTLEIPVVATEQYPKGLGGTVPEVKAAIPSFAPVEKNCFSCAGEPEFSRRLAALGRKQIVLMGVEVHVCVAQTALELASQGNSVYVVVDASGSRHPTDAHVALRRLESAGVGLVTAEGVVFEWLRRAGTDEFKAISRMVKELK